MPTLHCFVQGSQTIVILRVNIATRLEQEVRGLELPMTRCKAERCFPVLIRLVNVCAVLNKQVGHGKMTIGRCKMERSAEALFFWIKIDFVVMGLLQAHHEIWRLTT